MKEIKNLCIFCDLEGSEPLYKFSTFYANRSLYEMATEMGDRDLLIKNLGRDLVALEAKITSIACQTRCSVEHGTRALTALG